MEDKPNINADAIAILPTWGLPGMTFTVKMGKTSACGFPVGRLPVGPGDEVFFMSVAKTPDLNKPESLHAMQRIYWISAPKVCLP